MDKIRIGKDIKIFWELSATDESVILTQDDLTLEMTTPTGCVAILPFTFDEEEGTLTAYFYGIDHKQLGRYWLTVWYKQDEIGQSALDKVLAFQLVRSTEEETHNDDSIAYAQVNLSGSIEIYGGGTGTGSTYTKEEIDEMVSTIDSSIVNVSTGLSNHVTNTTIHVTAADKTRWDAKQDSGDYVTSSQLTAHTSNTAIHVTLEDKVKWDGKQDLITMDSSLDITSLNPVTNKAITTVIEENELVWAQALNELRNEIPTVGNATITIQKNGTSVGNFKTNASTNKSINITVPTTVASLTDSDYYFRKGQSIPKTNSTLSSDLLTANLFANKRTSDYFLCANALSGRFDYLYCAHLNTKITITSSNITNPTYMFNGDMADNALIREENFATLASDPAIIELTWDNLDRAVMTDTTYLMLLSHQMYNGDFLTNYKVEIYSKSSSSNSPFYGNDGWNTVLRRENVRDQVNGLIIPLGLTSGYSTLGGIRITIYGVEHVVTWTTHFPICEIKMIDSRPSFTAAQGLGGLDIKGGYVYGNTKFYNGIEGDLTGTLNGYSITNVTALPSNPNANTIYLITDN